MIAVLALVAVLESSGQVQATLVADVLAVAPGQPFTVALRLQHEPHWHTYWTNAGTGYPTALAWELPAGWQAEDIQWPTPRRIRNNAGKVTGNGYEGTTYLRVRITPAAGIRPGETVTLAATAEWLACAESCVPGSAKPNLSLPVAEQPMSNPQTAAEFAGIATPEKAPGKWAAEAWRGGTEVRLVLKPDSALGDPHFFSEDEALSYDAVQQVTNADGVLTLQVPMTPGEEAPSRLRGILAFEDGQGRYRGVQLDLPLQAEPVAPGGGSSPLSLFAAIGLAFVGGLVLNLMPCVFPVLGIKILGFVKQAGNNRREIAGHGAVFTAGVLLSFWALAAALAILRASGQELGWGFQLQSPAFVYALAILMLAFALSLSGVFEFGLSATGTGAGLQSKGGYAGSFFSGVLATIVATPCSAPFLAPALGAALALPVLESFAVFTAIALGLALPALLLSIMPSAARWLPRPGAWMETFKQATAFPLYASAGYLVWVLAGQTGESGLLLALFGLTLVAMAAWFYGRFAGFAVRPARRRLALGATALLLAAGTALGWPFAPRADDVRWEEWSPERVASLRSAGTAFYVDFTARWCATCQANKKIVFTDAEVKQTLRDRGIVMLKADWTNQDPRITAELARWQRSAVPFNLYYPPAGAEPRILPEILSPATVIAVLSAD